MPASDAHKLTVYIASAASASIEQLAQQHFDLGRELEATTDNEDCQQDSLRTLRECVDAIGRVRFGYFGWNAACDRIGFNQDVA